MTSIWPLAWAVWGMASGKQWKTGGVRANWLKSTVRVPAGGFVSKTILMARGVGLVLLYSLTGAWDEDKAASCKACGPSPSRFSLRGDSDVLSLGNPTALGRGTEIHLLLLEKILGSVHARSVFVQYQSGMRSDSRGRSPSAKVTWYQRRRHGRRRILSGTLPKFAARFSNTVSPIWHSCSRTTDHPAT